MKAMIFAAGLGTRLLPITEKMPKAMVKIHGKELLQWSIEKLIAEGFNEIIVNIHHFSGMMREFLLTRSFPGARIEISDETDKLLETGGGLKKASWFFNDNEPFLLYNVDVLCNFNLKELFREHQHNRALATLAVSERKTSRYLLFDRYRLMKGWINRKTGEIKPSGLEMDGLEALAFSGIHVINPEIIPLLQDGEKFSLTQSYVRLCNEHPIKYWKHSPEQWLDAGKPDVLRGIQEKPPERLFGHG